MNSIPNALAAPDAGVELERLGDEIAELSAHLDAATARLLDLIREFDARGGWNTGFLSCAQWLSWRVGLDRGAARERVRVARALGTLPRLAQALARGELSYSKVRALTRVATAETEERLLAVGRAGTAEHVERIVRGWRRVDRKAEAEETMRRHRNRALHVHQDEDGMVVVRGRMEPEVGAVLIQALAAAREDLYQRARAKQAEDVPAGTPTMAQQQADALGRLAETALHHGIDPGAPGERYQVVVHVDAQVLADADGPGQSVLEGGARGRGPFPLRCGARFSIAIAAVASRDAGAHSVKAITSAIGRTADRRRCRTWHCCVGGTTARSTRRGTWSSDSSMETFAFGARTGGYYRKSRKAPRCPRLPSTHCWRGTTQTGSTFTREPRCPAGWESASTLDMPSTSCTRWPRASVPPSTSRRPSRADRADRRRATRAPPRI